MNGEGVLGSATPTVSNSFGFGVISDVQYADHEDAVAIFPPYRKRFYRHGLQHLQIAFEEFKSENVEFVLQLGDLIDGKSKRESELALQKVSDIIGETGVDVHHTLGNHDLYNFTHKEAIANIVKSRNDDSSKGYYSFVSHNFRFISLDSYDVAMLGRSRDEETYAQSKEYLAVNKNSDLNSPTGLEGDQRRFVGYNGGLGADQLAWLSEELKMSEQSNQKVVVFGHCGISPLVSPLNCLLWNYSQVLELLESSPSVRLVFSGHSHHHNYKISSTGKCYFTLRGVIETPPDEKAWILVNIQEEAIHFKMYDGAVCETLTVPL